MGGLHRHLFYSVLKRIDDRLGLFKNLFMHVVAITVQPNRTSAQCGLFYRSFNHLATFIVDDNRCTLNIGNISVFHKNKLLRYC
jgi:hypothetical protein